MPRQMMVAPGGGVGAPLGVQAAGVGTPLGVGGPPINGGVAQAQPAVLVQGQVTIYKSCFLYSLHLSCAWIWPLLCDDLPCRMFANHIVWLHCFIFPNFSAPQEPLTASMLAAAPQQDQKQMLGERMFPLVQVRFPLLLSLLKKIYLNELHFPGHISRPGWQGDGDAVGH